MWSWCCLHCGPHSVQKGSSMLRTQTSPAKESFWWHHQLLWITSTGNVLNIVGFKGFIMLMNPTMWPGTTISKWMSTDWNTHLQFSWVAACWRTGTLWVPGQLLRWHLADALLLLTSAEYICTAHWRASAPAPGCSNTLTYLPGYAYTKL